MRESRQAAFVGFIILTCLIAAVFGVIWLSGAGMFRDDYTVHIIFQRAKNLNKGTAVKLEGTNIGKIIDIAFSKDKGTVAMASISKGVEIPEDSRFMLESNLMDQTINIYRGTSEKILENKAEVKGVYKDIFESFYKLSAKSDEALTSLFTPENIAAYTVTIREMSRTIEELRKMIVENRQSFNVVLKNLEMTTNQVNSLFRENREGIHNVVNQLTESGKSFGNLVKTSDSLLSDMNQIAGRVNKGKGSLGKLLSEDQVYEDILNTTMAMRKVAENLNRLSARTETLIVRTDTLITDIKKNPRKYLKISIF